MARVLALRHQCIDDVMYSNTLFSSVCSIREFKCFQLFYFKKSKFEKIILIHRKAQAPEVYEDCIRNIGTLNKTRKEGKCQLS